VPFAEVSNTGRDSQFSFLSDGGGDQTHSQEFEIRHSESDVPIKCSSAKLGAVVHACNSQFRRLMQDDHEFEASLGYIASSGQV
jgi:hypothetical protein